MDKTTGDERAALEIKVTKIAKAYDENLAVTFGKNGSRGTTVSITKLEKLLVQLNFSDSQTVTGKVKSITWEFISNLKET